jgi:hypothetical protein
MNARLVGNGKVNIANVSGNGFDELTDALQLVMPNTGDIVSGLIWDSIDDPVVHKTPSEQYLTLDNKIPQVDKS